MAEGGPRNAGVPVVMLTAGHDPHFNQKAFEAGAVACLTKPCRRGTPVNCVDLATASGARARERAG